MKWDRAAILGGPKAVETSPKDLFKWPIITDEDEQAVLDVLRNGSMSGTDITKQFEADFARWYGVPYALGYNSGTSSIHGAMFGCKLGVGDEIICPSITYWASVLQIFSLGATVVFADIDPDTLCLDPQDIERRITGRTKAILVVHYLAHPADMDAIMDIARRHDLKVIEDVSHAQGGLYKGRKLGTIGDVGAMSLMSGKSFAIGEAGMLVTRHRDIYERAVAFGHYERFADNVASEELAPFRGVPLGGYKHRMHQMSSAVGRVQIKSYEERCREIRKAMNYFWDVLEGVPGIKPHRIQEDADNHMAGWYSPHGIYRPEELGGLSVQRFVEALCAEGCFSIAGVNAPLHKHPMLSSCDVYGHGKPTRIAHSAWDVRSGDRGLPVSEAINDVTYSIPWFKHYWPDCIEPYANAFRKVAYQFKDLLEGDDKRTNSGAFHFFRANG